MKWLIEYFRPHRRIERKLVRLAAYAAKNGFTVAPNRFMDIAKEFRDFKP